MTSDTKDSALPIFLGMSHRAARRGHVWDLLGVTNLILFPFFPQPLTGLQCILGIDRRLLVSKPVSYRLLLTDQSRPNNQGWVDQNLGFVSRKAEDTERRETGGFAVPAAPLEGGQNEFGWSLIGAQDEDTGMEIFPTPAPPLIIWAPSRVLVDIELENNRYRRGEFICAFAPPPPLSEEERRAIASRPGASKAVVFHLGCKLCGDDVNYFTQLLPHERKSEHIPTNAVVLHEAPASWHCMCGTQSVELSYLKQGLHDLFRRPPSVTSDNAVLQFTPLYEAGRIQNLIAEYEELIETTTAEEPVQKYLEANPLFWAFLSPTKILHKPAILTKKKADFGILSRQKILYLVELEKPATKLTNKDGAISAEIQKGADQIRDWQLVVSDHRLTLLSQLDLKETEVQEIHYVLIGGLARRTNAAALTKLRRSPLAPNTDFYCFDELGSFLHTLAGELRRL